MCIPAVSIDSRHLCPGLLRHSVEEARQTVAGLFHAYQPRGLVLDADKILQFGVTGVW